ncbi:MAG: copper-binding protein [Bryobacteraceae bacterium]
MMLRLALLTTLLLAVIGCRSATPKPPETKTYSIRGEVLRLDNVNHTAVLKHDKIEGWMEAMTMEFPVKDPAEFAKLSVGDQMQAKLQVNDIEYYLVQIQVTAKAPAK